MSKMKARKASDNDKQKLTWILKDKFFSPQYIKCYSSLEKKSLAQKMDKLNRMVEWTYFYNITIIKQEHFLVYLCKLLKISST